MEPIDKKFTDHAWSEMHQLLDKEMPVTAPRRRLVGWWPLGLGLFLAIGVAAFFQLRPTEVPPVEQAQTAVAATELPPEKPAAAPATPAPQADLPQAKSTAEAPAAQLDRAQPSRKSASQSTAAPFQYTRPKPPADTQPADNQGLLLKNSTAPKITAIPAPLDGAPLRLAQPHPAAVAWLAMQPLPQPKPAAPAVAAKIHRPNRVALHAYASAFFAPQSKARGTGIGVLAWMPLGKGRFSFGTGLGHAYLQQPLLVRSDAGADVDPSSTPTNQEDDTQITFSSGDENISADLAEESSNSIQLQQRLDLHYLDLPLMLQVRQGRWRVTAGLNAALLLATRSDFAAGGLLRFDKNRGLDQSIGSSTFSRFPEKMMVKNVDLAAVGGIGYDLSPTLGLNLHYRTGLTDVLPDNHAKEFNRLLQFSLSYRIGGW